MKLGVLAIAVLAVCVTASCASRPEVADDAVAQKRECINTNAVRSFDALTDKHVYVRQGRDEYFLLTMRTRCLNLRDANSIAIADTMNRVCSKSFARIIYRDRFSGRGLESCQIDTIERVGSKEHAKKIVETRTAPPDKKNEGTWTELPDPE